MIRLFRLGWLIGFVLVCSLLVPLIATQAIRSPPKRKIHAGVRANSELVSKSNSGGDRALCPARKEILDDAFELTHILENSDAGVSSIRRYGSDGDSSCSSLCSIRHVGVNRQHEDRPLRTWRSLNYGADPPKWGHTLTLLATGKALAAGGNTKYAIASLARLFDPSDNSWSGPNSVMTTPRQSHTATLLPNGQVLVTGGQVLNSNRTLTYSASAELYTPQLQSWSL